MKSKKLSLNFIRLILYYKARPNSEKSNAFSFIFIQNSPSYILHLKLFALMRLSVDQYFHPDKKPEKSTQRRQLEALLDELDDPDLMVVSGTVKGILEARDAFGKKIAD